MTFCPRHGSPEDAATRPARCAVLVFAESPTLFSAGRSWGPSGKPVANALIARAVRVAQRSAVGDVHVFTRGKFDARDLGPVTRGMIFHTQHGGTFGRRLENAVDAIRRTGYDRVVIIGTDVPGLRAAHVRQAASLLETSTMALGADHHGGCYTVALHLTVAHLLQNIVWGSNTDFAELLSRRPDAAVLPQRLCDVDSTADLRGVLADKAYRLPARLRAMLGSFFAACVVVGQSARPLPARAAVRLARQTWQLPPPMAA